MSERLGGKTAFITGAASGIGRASALMFAGQGARVMACDINADGGQEAAAAIRDSGGDAEFVLADVTGTPEDIASVALFLASDESRMITAQTIVADGGLGSY